MLASSFLDPVLGLDIHFEMVPTPAPVPLPIPNPFIGLVFDPIGLAAGIAIGAVVGAVVGAPFQGPVLYWTAFPATNTGTEAKHVPGHFLIPPGTMWAPFPKTPKPVIHPGEVPTPGLPVKPENDAVVITGSKTVTVMGSNAVRLGDIALSCSEPLRLPSSVVLAIPKGAPILIGGPMSLDIMSAIMASLRTRFVSDSLHALISRLKPSRFRNFLHRAVCFFTGHPVDVASGKVMTEFVDIELPGPIPLKVERIYSSAFASRPGPVGHGWSLSLDQSLWRERGKVVLLAEDGREIEFDTFDFPKHRIDAGQKVYNPIERLTLHCDKGETWRVVDHEGVVRQFAPVPGRDDGRAMIQKVRSRCGHHEITFHYGAEGTARGRLEWVRDSGGRLVRLRWDAQGRVTELHLPQPQGEGFYCHRRYEYDAAGDLVAVTDSLGHAWRFAYVTHLLTQETDRNGLSFYFQYDGLGEDAWCVRTWGDGGIYDHVLSYDKRKRVTFVTNSLGYTTQYHMNLVGQVVKIVDPLGGETNYEYDPITLQRTKLVDELGAEMAWCYDLRGNLLAVTTPTGARLEWSYDDQDRRVAAQDANGGQWRWSHGPHHELRSARDPLGTTTTCSWERGRLVEVLDPGGSTRLSYDAHGNLVEVRTPDEGVKRWVHDRLGNILLVQDPRGARQARRLDLEGRVVEVGEPDGNIRRYRYDAEGRIVTASDHESEVHFQYRGRLCLVRRDEADETLSFEHDSEERVTAIVNAVGARHQYARSPRGDIVWESNFDGSEHHYERDVTGRMQRHRRPSGRTSTYRFDAAGRVLEVDHGDQHVESFAYRADGLLIRATNRDCSVQLERDLQGRVVREIQGDHWVETVYGPSGLRIASRTSLGIAQGIGRNAMGDVVEITIDRPDAVAGGAQAWRALVTRDLAGAAQSWSLPGRVIEHWSFDRAGRPVDHVVDTATGVWRRHSTFGVDDRIGRVIDEMGRETHFHHDRLGNLVGTSSSTGEYRGRHIDPGGNPHRRADFLDRHYDAGGRALAMQAVDGLVRHEYDADGNLTRRDEPGGTWRYQWDGAGRLTAVEPPNADAVRFTYDPFGRRVRKEQGNQTTTWIWDQMNPAHELGPSENDTISWIFEPESLTPIAKLAGSGSWSIISDHVGTPQLMLDEHGEISWQAEVDAWGAATIIHGSPTDCPFRGPGQYEDTESGLYYNRFRYYDPKLGAYVSRDPLGRAAGLHDYGYVPDPMRWLDPLGLIILYHYTDEAGMNGIVNSNTIRPSTAPKNTKFGIGQYFTDIPPSQVAGRTLSDLTAADKAANKISLGQLAKELYGDTRRMSTCAFFVAVDIDDSMVKFCRPGTYVIENLGDLDVKGQIVDHGPTCV